MNYIDTCDKMVEYPTYNSFDSKLLNRSHAKPLSDPTPPRQKVGSNPTRNGAIDDLPGYSTLRISFLITRNPLVHAFYDNCIKRPAGPD